MMCSQESVDSNYLKSLPLPPGFRKEEDVKEGRVWYINELMGEKTDVHPADKYLNQKKAAAGEMGLHSSSMVIDDEEGAGDILNETSSSTIFHHQALLNNNGGAPSLTHCHAKQVRRRTNNPIPSALNFTSWWSESAMSNSSSGASGMIRKYVDISFIPKDGSFVVRAKGSKENLSISHLVNKYGIVCELDLHIGATLKVLGRSLTLRQADFATQEWLEKERIRLIKIRNHLCAELAKYSTEYQSLSNEYSGDKERAAAREGTGLQETRSKIAAYPLRRYKMEAQELFKHLKALRPKLAVRLDQEFGLSTLLSE